MKTVSISRLKASLSQYLAHVKAGEEVIVTDRGKPVARMLPVRLPPDAPERLLQMAREGRIRLPERWPTKEWAEEFLALPRPEDPEGLVRKALDEDREDRF